MKQKYHLLFLFLGMILLSNTVSAQSFSRTYGDGNENLVTRTKTYKGQIYVAGARVVNGQRHATFSRLQANGTLDWTVELDGQSNPLDFEIIIEEVGGPATGFFLVGHDGTLVNGSDNRSFIAKITPTGAVQWTRYYDNLNRREAFRRVIRRQIVPDVGEEYFVLGLINHDSTTADSWDRGWILRMNGNGDISSSQLYHYQPGLNSNTDSELATNIIGWGNTSNLIAGNVLDGETFGVVFTADRQTGAVGQTWKLPSDRLVTDVYRMTAGEGNDLIIAGLVRGSQPAASFVARINATDFSTRWCYQIPDMASVDNIGSDGYGNLYLAGAESANRLDPLILKITQDATSATLADAKRIIVPGDAGLQEPQLWVRSGMNQLLYADSRVKSNTQGFGGLDWHVGMYHPSLDSMYSCYEKLTKNLVLKDFLLEAQLVTNINFAVPPPVTVKGDMIAYNHIDDMCTPDTTVDCCSAIQALPSGEDCNCARLVFSTNEESCMPPKIGLNVTGDATIDQVQVFYADCTTQTINVDDNNSSFSPTSGCQITQIVACLNSGFTSPTTLSWHLFYGGLTDDCLFEQEMNCPPPPPGACCPNASVKPCLCTPGSGNINYEVHLDIPGSGSVCQLTDFSISGISYTSVGSVYIDSDPVMAGNVFWPTAGTGTFPWNSITLTGAAEQELVFVINVPINFSGSMTFNSISCDGTICSFSIPIEPQEEGENIEMEAVSFEDSLFAMKLRIKPEVSSDSLKLRYVSLRTCCSGDAATGTTNPDQPDIFALTGATNLVDPSEANNFQFKSAAMGKNSAYFELLQPLSLSNFPDDVFLHLVTTQKVDSLFMAFFDENGSLIHTTNLANPAQQEIVSVVNNYALQADVALSPNPATEQTNLEFSLKESQQVIVEVMDLTGRPLWDKNLGLCRKGEKQNLVIHTGDFPAGTYLLRIKSEQGTSSIKRLVVMH